MLNSAIITEAVSQIRMSLQSMSPEDLRREYDAFQTTDVYDLLFHSGHFESNVDVHSGERAYSFQSVVDGTKR